jgi:hypothetical protein
MIVSTFIECEKESLLVDKCHLSLLRPPSISPTRPESPDPSLIPNTSQSLFQSTSTTFALAGIACIQFRLSSRGGVSSDDRAGSFLPWRAGVHILIPATPLYAYKKAAKKKKVRPVAASLPEDFCIIRRRPKDPRWLFYTCLLAAVTPIPSSL